MHPVIIHDKIVLEDEIKEVKNVVLDDEIKLEKKENGLKFDGVIKLTGEAYFASFNKSFQKDIDVDLFIDHEVKEDENYSLYVEDFFYSISSNMILLTIKLNVKSSLVPLNPKIEKNNDFLEEFSKYINEENVEVISTVDEFNREEEEDKEKELILEDNSSKDEVEVLDNIEIKLEDEEDRSIKNEEEKQNEEIEKNKKEDLPKAQESILPINLDDVNKEKKSEKEEEKVDEEKLDSPLLEEDYAIMFTYYRVNKGDTLDSIKEKFNVDESTLNEYNPSSNFEEDDLILFPR